LLAHDAHGCDSSSGDGAWILSRDSASLSVRRAKYRASTVVARRALHGASRTSRLDLIPDDWSPRCVPALLPSALP
jgi:hypothetical protein